jgi:hypothetical protein
MMVGYIGGEWWNMGNEGCCKRLEVS